MISTEAGFTPVQMQHFERHGFCTLPCAVPPALLERLRLLFDELIHDAGFYEKAVDTVNGRNYVSGLHHFCHKGNLAALEMLGMPLIQATAEAICGRDFFMIQEFAVIKELGNTLPVLWHKDMEHEGKGRCCTMGIYLDDANAGDGALRLIPGSHKSGKDICELEAGPFIEAPMKAGDILVHDMLLAHSSQPLVHNPLRRVLYFEFLSAAHVRAESIYTEDLIVNRQRLLQLALDYNRQLETGVLQPGPAPDEAKGFRQLLNDLYRFPLRARPSAYCFAHFNYPEG